SLPARLPANLPSSPRGGLCLSQMDSSAASMLSAADASGEGDGAASGAVTAPDSMAATVSLVSSLMSALFPVVAAEGALRHRLSAELPHEHAEAAALVGALADRLLELHAHAGAVGLPPLLVLGQRRQFRRSPVGVTEVPEILAVGAG